jgi:hypothetical protein
MHIISTLVLSIVLLILTACEDKKKSDRDLTETNNTSTVSKKNIKHHTSDTNHTKYHHTFTIKDIKQNSYQFSIEGKNIYSDSFHNKTLLLNLSHISSPISLDQAESLSKLQTKYQSAIIVVTLLLGDTQNISNPNIFLNQNHIYHFVSLDKKNKEIADLLYASLKIKEKHMPLTIIYKNGKYYSHFEGATPIEMINHDILQTIKK